MLDFESFQQYVKDNIKDFLPSEFAHAEVNLQTVNKNNGKQLHGITIRTGENPVCPNIYLDQFYENYKEQGMDIDVVMERVAQLELEHMNPSEDFSSIAEKFKDVEFIKSHVVVAIVNAEKNVEMLQNTPHKLTEDLAIIYKVYLGGGSDGIGTITIKDEHMKQWDISLDELHACAMENSKTIMPAKVQDMGSVLAEMMGGMPEDMMPMVAEDKMMYVISNEQKVNGAASIIYSDALEKLSEKLGTDLYILPSSIHETIAISANFGTPEELAQMVREVNATQVSQEEQLSDHVYKYDAKTKTLSLADVEGLSQDISKVSEDKQTYDAVNTEVSRPRHHR